MKPRLKNALLISALLLLTILFGVGYFSERNKEKKIQSNIETQIGILNSFVETNNADIIDSRNKIEKDISDLGYPPNLATFLKNFNTCITEFIVCDSLIKEAEEKNVESLLFSGQELIEKTEVLTGTLQTEFATSIDRKTIAQKSNKLKLLISNTKDMEYQGQKISFQSNPSLYKAILRTEFSLYIKSFSSLSSTGIDQYTTVLNRRLYPR